MSENEKPDIVEIEVTPAMIEAGGDYLDRMFAGWDMNVSPSTCREFAKTVFNLMVDASRSQPK